jgi:TM2 domain-containing membrane protein YozV
MPLSTDPRAALLSTLVPGLGQFMQGRPVQAVATCLAALLLLALPVWLGQIAGRVVEVFVFMVLTLPGWIFQSYDAYLGSSPDHADWRRTGRAVWQRGHDLRFLGLLLVISAFTDTWIILNNLDYLLPFYCLKPDGILGLSAKAISPALHLAVGYGFLRLRRWALFLYLVYATYGFTNGVVNLTCFGPGRIRNTLLIVVVLSTAYILWRRHVLLGSPAGKRRVPS